MSAIKNRKRHYFPLSRSPGGSGITELNCKRKKKLADGGGKEGEE